MGSGKLIVFRALHIDLSFQNFSYSVLNACNMKLRRPVNRRIVSFAAQLLVLLRRMRDYSVLSPIPKRRREAWDAETAEAGAAARMIRAALVDTVGVNELSKLSKETRRQGRGYDG